MFIIIIARNITDHNPIRFRAFIAVSHQVYVINHPAHRFEEGEREVSLPTPIAALSRIIVSFNRRKTDDEPIGMMIKMISTLMHRYVDVDGYVWRVIKK